MFRPTLKFEKIKPGGDVNFVNRPQIRKTLKKLHGVETQCFSRCRTKDS